jgi:biopolymer transport protein ExbD
MAAAISAGREPLAEINTTPLIDVLLVLLIMLVLTLPMGTNTLEVNLPGDGPRLHQPDPVSNRLVVTEQNAILWNGQAVSRAELDGLLGAVRTIRPEPQVRFEPEAQASYDLSANVLNQVKQAQLTNFGIAGSERYRAFQRD